MFKFSNGHKLEFVVASGALGFDAKGWLHEQPLRWMGLLDPSLFTVVIKTLTREPRKGNLRWYKPWACIKPIHGGVVNAVGLTNPGIEWWCKKIGPKINSKKIPVIASILGDIKDLIVMADMLDDFDLVGLEINASCPNTNGDLLRNTNEIIYGCQMVKEASRFPLILKLSVLNNVKRIVDETKGIVEAYSINSIPWKFIFPDKKSPLEKFGGGGVSGRVAQPYTWDLAFRLMDMSPVPVIAPSIWNFKDMDILKSMGAEAISFGSIFTLYPWRPTMFVRRIKKREIKLNGFYS